MQNEYCAHATCGAPDSEGHCTMIPIECEEPGWQPVCDCKGQVVSPYCGGFDVGPASGCKTFPCGNAQCDIKTQYCRRDISDVGGVPDTFTCSPLPAGCGSAPTCGCLASVPCQSQCEGDGSLGLLVSCPGG
jgi:hypothetical protein